MPSFGEKLKREREKRTVTLEQISVSTKIGTRMLQALEEEKFDQLPGGIFNKGFVRAYARCIGLDEEQAVADYLEASGEAAPPRIEAAAELERNVPDSTARRTSRDLPWGLLAAGLLLVALVLSVWSYRQRERHPAGASSPPATPTSSVTGPPASLATPPGEVKSVPPPSNAPTKQVPGVTAPTHSAVAPAPSPAVPGEFIVVIQAREDSWLSLTADGETIHSGMLGAGTQRSVRAHEEVVVRTGNTGGVDFFFNGKKLAAQGGYGEVKTLTFGATGLVPNRPSPPVTQ